MDWASRRSRILFGCGLKHAGRGRHGTVPRTVYSYQYINQGAIGRPSESRHSDAEFLRVGSSIQPTWLHLSADPTSLALATIGNYWGYILPLVVGYGVLRSTNSLIPDRTQLGQYYYGYHTITAYVSSSQNLFHNNTNSSWFMCWVHTL